ncbi:DUF3577 domain-containing protein [Pseudomonas oryzihabitans]|uniref:DUF3577 domain-containing protein n=1 Tax=Pseudomonas oryzihabitans TaxID=47885 RepID=UPI0011A532B9
MGDCTSGQGLLSAETASKKVPVSFRIGDCCAGSFSYSSGPKEGAPGASLKGRLLYIGWIKVDGETVYEAKLRDAAPAEQQGTDQRDDSDQPAA